MLDGTNSCCESEKAAPCRKIIVLNISPCIPWARGTPVSVECVNTLTRTGRDNRCYGTVTARSQVKTCGRSCVRGVALCGLEGSALPPLTPLSFFRADWV
jgi:hypothetical protein